MEQKHLVEFMTSYYFIQNLKSIPGIPSINHIQKNMSKKPTDMLSQKLVNYMHLEIYQDQVVDQKEIQDTSSWDLQGIGDIVKQV